MYPSYPGSRAPALPSREPSTGGQRADSNRGTLHYEPAADMLGRDRGRRPRFCIRIDKRGALTTAWKSGTIAARNHLQLDRLDPQIIRQQRLVLPKLTDHRLGGLPLEEELGVLLGLGADDAVEGTCGASPPCSPCSLPSVPTWPRVQYSPRQRSSKAERRGHARRSMTSRACLAGTMAT